MINIFWKLTPITLALAITSTAAQTETEKLLIDQFKLISGACKLAFEKSPRVLQNARGAWVRQRYINPVFVIDIKKTDSLISPLSGSVEVKYVIRSESALSEDEVRALPFNDDGPSANITETIRYALVDGKWSGTGVDKTIQIRLSKDAQLGAPRKMIEKKEESIKYAVPASDCLLAPDIVR